MFGEMFKIDELEFNGEKRGGEILVVDHNVEQTIASRLNRHFRIDICDNLGMALLKDLGIGERC